MKRYVRSAAGTNSYSSLSRSVRRVLSWGSAIFMFALTAHSAEEWVQHFSAGAATAAATDASGDVFVTGSSPGSSVMDLLTLKYSPAGVCLWTNRFDLAGYGNNTPHGLAVDSSGNVIVAAACTSTNGHYDYVTLKYSNSGVPLWTNVYNGPGNSDDMLAAMAIDSSGDVFVTGGSAATGSYPYDDPVNLDYATVGYSSAGVPLWTNRYDGLGHSNDQATAIAVDTNGNVLVTGIAVSTNSVVEYVTLKYSPAGTGLWTNRYFAGGMNVQPKAIAADKNGNVFITGSMASATFDDYLTLKYSSGGALLWTNSYAGPGAGTDDPNAIALDAHGNVFVTGYSRGTNFPEFATIKYSNDGVPVWTNRFNASLDNESVATAMALDGVGHVIVTGFFVANVTAENILTIAYSNDGFLVATNEYSSGNNLWDQANAVAVDRAGNYFVAGLSQTPTNNVFTVIKYAALSGPVLGVQGVPGAIVLSWPVGFSLQATSGLGVSFTNVPAAVSPYTNATAAPRGFFRLISN